MIDVRASLLRIGLLLAVLGSAAQAQDNRWALRMFDETSFDFGVVARGADVRHRFRIYNGYQQTVHISEVRSTCGCSAANPTQQTLQPGESTYVEITMDTRRFLRSKDSTLIVTFDRPAYAEVRIPVKVYIRSDVVFTPGSVQFGAVGQGETAVRKVDVAYAGRNDWTIREVKLDNEHLDARLVEQSRDNGHVNYELQVTLKPTAPVGPIREEITLVTDDSGSPHVPLRVSADVEPDVNVTISPLGTMTAGSKKTFNVVLRGRRPFTIEKIVCDTEGMFHVRLSKRESQIHVLPISFTVPDKAGGFSESFTVTISGREEPLTFRASGRIAAR